MHRIVLACLLMTASAHAINVNGACPVTVGTLTLNVTTPRAACISPCLVFFDATATTDSTVTTNMTPFQDVTYTWNFGDTLGSGTSTWAYGARPGVNVRNKATGAIAAHLYITQGRDTKYTATVTATDGTNTAICGIGATAYDPNGANGFPTTTTICVAAASTPAAGVGGCPAGASVLNQSSFATALSGSRSAKRTLFKCGDTFTGTDTTLTGTTWTVGAYGGCEGTQTNRPIFSSPGNTSGALLVASSAIDGRIADIDFEGGGTGNAAVSETGTFALVESQITLYNLLSNGMSSNYATSGSQQFGIIQSVSTGMRNGIGTYINFGGEVPGQWAGNPNGNNADYQALLGNSFDGTGAAGGSGIETLRFSACRLCVIENNVAKNANNIGAVLKVQESNGSVPAPWIGIYDEYIMITDNLFTGLSGGQSVEISPENGAYDERLRNIVLERNLFAPPNGINDALIISAQNTTLRDNVFFIASGQAAPVGFIAQIGTRPSVTVTGLSQAASAVVTNNSASTVNPFNVGSTLTFYSVAGMTQINGLTGTITAIGGSAGAWTETVNINSSAFTAYSSGGTVSAFPTQYIEAYNNTCYVLSTSASQHCINFSGRVPLSLNPQNSIAKNNLFFDTFAGALAVNDAGAADTVSNNTATPANDPSITNGSTTFSLISDFKPTANYTGGATVPVFYDALGVAWSPWDWGAVRH